jgi:hypothetical protein
MKLKIFPRFRSKLFFRPVLVKTIRENPQPTCPSSIAFGCKVSSIQRCREIVTTDAIMQKCPRNFFIIHCACAFLLLQFFLIIYSVMLLFSISLPETKYLEIAFTLNHLAHFFVSFSIPISYIMSFPFKLPYFMQ